MFGCCGSRTASARREYQELNGDILPLATPSEPVRPTSPDTPGATLSHEDFLQRLEGKNFSVSLRSNQTEIVKISNLALRTLPSSPSQFYLDSSEATPTHQFTFNPHLNGGYFVEYTHQKGTATFELSMPQAGERTLFFTANEPRAEFLSQVCEKLHIEFS